MTNTDILAVTTQYINKKIINVMQSENAAYNIVFKNKKYLDGGKSYDLPINYTNNPNIQAISGNGAVIPNNQFPSTTSASFDWKYFSVPFSITLDDMTKTQSSKEAVISMYELKMNNTINSAIQFFTSQIWGSGYGSTALNMNGFADIFAASGTQYGGISNTTYSNWFYSADTTTTAITTQSINSLLSGLKKRVGQQPLSPRFDQANKITHLLSCENALTEYSNNSQNQQMYVNSTTLDSGFVKARVNGVEWFTDEWAPGGAQDTYYNLSTGNVYIYALCAPGFEFFYKYGFGGEDQMGNASPMDVKQMTLPTQPIQQDIHYMAGNLSCNRFIQAVGTAYQTTTI